MPRGSPERTQIRKEEIMDACEALYETMNFHDITLKEIGEVTSLSRPSIYNYFETKEEIFLALFEREYERWTEDLLQIQEEHEKLTCEQLADLVALSLEKRKLLLKILSVNLYDMEENSRMERLVSFKLAYKRSAEAVKALVRKFCPEKDVNAVERFALVFLPFLHGVHPYAFSTPKQMEAMDQAGVPYGGLTIYSLVYEGMRNILNQA